MFRLLQPPLPPLLEPYCWAQECPCSVPICALPVALVPHGSVARQHGWAAGLGSMAGPQGWAAGLG